MHRRAPHAIMMHRRGFSTFRRGCVASQRVPGPICGFNRLHEIQGVSVCCVCVCVEGGGGA